MSVINSFRYIRHTHVSLFVAVGSITDVGAAWIDEEAVAADTITEVATTREATTITTTISEETTKVITVDVTIITMVTIGANSNK